jgi:hypothetical protein
MVVRSVHDRDLGFRMVEMLAKSQPAKSCPQHHYLSVPVLHIRQSLSIQLEMQFSVDRC